MYDPLRSTFTFSCPHREHVRVPLSSFRSLGRLPGTSHPPVYHVEFACTCGGEHAGLVTQTELDWGHLGTTADLTFRNLMTSRDDALSDELTQTAAARIGAGEWPWSFFCWLENRPRPITPSALSLIAPGGRLFGVAVECPACWSLSVNLVTQEHVDVPFCNDGRVGVVPHVFEPDALRISEEFEAELASASFDERRLHLAP